MKVKEEAKPEPKAEPKPVPSVVELGTPKVAEESKDDQKPAPSKSSDKPAPLDGKIVNKLSHSKSIKKS